MAENETREKRPERKVGRPRKLQPSKPPSARKAKIVTSKGELFSMSIYVDPKEYRALSEAASVEEGIR